jgi:AcrR family transcriptional regulator
MSLASDVGNVALLMSAVKRPAAPRASRKEQARATALRIVRAAHELFVERGYTGTRMTDVAEAAGVAVQTVYFRFHTKSELLQACYEHAVLGEDDPRPPMEQPWFARFLAARTGSAALREFAVGNTEIVTRVGQLDDIVRSAAHEPDAVAVRTNSERLRREGYALFVQHIADRFGLHPGLDADRATDLLLAYGGTSMWRSLVIDDGWSTDEYVDWLAATLAGQLLPPARRRAR